MKIENFWDDPRRRRNFFIGFANEKGFDPLHADSLHLLGIIAHETRRPQRAVALIGQAIRSNPNFATAYDSLANALNDLGRRDEALANCEKAIALDPRFVEAYVNRGNILHALQRHHGRFIVLPFQGGFRPVGQTPGTLRGQQHQIE